jgi:hypothetical protein
MDVVPERASFFGDTAAPAAVARKASRQLRLFISTISASESVSRLYLFIMLPLWLNIGDLAHLALS